jgi:hypothetical protein
MGKPSDWPSHECRTRVGSGLRRAGLLRNGQGIDRWVAIPGCRGAASCRPVRSWPLGRRWGRVPARPDPPPRSAHWTAAEDHRARRDWSGAVQRPMYNKIKLSLQIILM